MYSPGALREGLARQAGAIMFRKAWQADPSNTASAAGGLIVAIAAGLRLAGRNRVCELENAWRILTRKGRNFLCLRHIGGRLESRQRASHGSRQPVVIREEIRRI